MNLKKCIIFGTGSSGEMAYYKLKDRYEIIGYTDNNKDKWNKTFMNISIMNPEKIKEYGDDTEIFVASQFYREICEQLENMGVKNIKYIDEGIICDYLTKNRLNYTFEPYERKLRKILVVQNKPCIRTYRTSTILDDLGIQVDLAYFTQHPDMIFPNQKHPWKNIYPMNDLNEFMDFVNKSDYDLIHSSNEPDTITALLLYSNKKVVHDIHDLETFRAESNFDKMILEKIVLTYSNALITVGNYVKEYIIKNYNLNNKKIFTLGNIPLQVFKPTKIFNKLSQIDGELHCVYEGAINANKGNSHRCFDNIFLEIAKKNIHLHFYSNSKDVAYLKYLDSLHPYLHYEGFKGHIELISELTKYDVGLLSYNINSDNCRQIIYSSPNKLFDYLSAGIPVAVSDVLEGIEIVNKYNVGREINYDETLKEQLIEISKLKVEDNFLEKHKFTLDSYKNEILQFYESVM